ncbi:MAG: hypothetical protein GXP25_15680 [Planctomycetes bacterium]|nr:hypothetical protein [Planctomycetota bacterium]
MNRLWTFFLFLLLALPVGCKNVPTVNDFAKQEFVVDHKPPVHLAVRGSRSGRKVVCQVFLLTASRSLWISGADIRQADGTVLGPKRIKSLEQREEDEGAPISIGFGFGVGTTRGGGFGGEESCADSWSSSGSSTSYGTGFGVGIPVWRLLGGSSGRETPRSLEFTYELPAAQASCEGCEVIVYVAQTSKATEKKKKDRDKKSAVEAEMKNRIPVAFVMAEAAVKKDEKADDTKETTKRLVREIQFTLKRTT